MYKKAVYIVYILDTPDTCGRGKPVLHGVEGGGVGGVGLVFPLLEPSHSARDEGVCPCVMSLKSGLKGWQTAAWC